MCNIVLPNCKHWAWLPNATIMIFFIRLFIVEYVPDGQVLIVFQPLCCNAVHYSVSAVGMERTKRFFIRTHQSLYPLHLARLCWTPFYRAAGFLCSVKREIFDHIDETALHSRCRFAGFYDANLPFPLPRAKCASLDGDLVTAGAMWVQWSCVQNNILRSFKLRDRMRCPAARIHQKILHCGHKQMDVVSSGAQVVGV